MVIRRTMKTMVMMAILLMICMGAAVSVQAADGFTIDSDNYLTGYTGGGGAVIIPDGVTRIKSGVFQGRRDITSVTIPNTVIQIDYAAFNNCENLTNITIPGNVWFIGEQAFANCKSLTSVTIPSSVTSMSKNAFTGCTALTSVTLSNNFIGDGMFKDCTSLTSITIPGNVSDIKSNAFEGCSNLARVTIKNGDTDIGTDAFKNISPSVVFDVPKGSKAYQSLVATGFISEGSSGNGNLPNTSADNKEDLHFILFCSLAVLTICTYAWKRRFADR